MISTMLAGLLKMTADYTGEFIWIMSQYKTYSREDAKVYETIRNCIVEMGRLIDLSDTYDII